jgi:hypothetical protein
MRILFIGHQFELSEIQSFKGVHSHFLVQQFKQKGHKVYTLNYDASTLRASQFQKPIDFIFSVQRWDLLKEHIRQHIRLCFDKIPPIFTLSNKGQGNNPNECVFSMLYLTKGQGNVIPISWACCPTLLTPNQPKYTINILLDHIHYGKAGQNSIYEYYHTALAKLQTQYNIKTEIIGHSSNFQLVPFKAVTTYKLSKWIDIVPLYRTTHIFCVTHAESLGLSVLETAMCGAHIIIPNNYIRSELLNNVAHTKIKGTPDNIYAGIANIINNFDAQKNRKTVEKYTWENLATTILKSIMERL